MLLMHCKCHKTSRNMKQAGIHGTWNKLASTEHETSWHPREHKNKMPSMEHKTSWHPRNMKQAGIHGTWKQAGIHGTWNKLASTEHETSWHPRNMKQAGIHGTWNKLASTERGRFHGTWNKVDSLEMCFGIEPFPVFEWIARFVFWSTCPHFAFDWLIDRLT